MTLLGKKKSGDNQQCGKQKVRKCTRRKNESDMGKQKNTIKKNEKKHSNIYIYIYEKKNQLEDKMVFKGREMLRLRHSSSFYRLGLLQKW